MALVSHCTTAAVYKPTELLAIPQLDKSVMSTMQRRTLAIRNINCYWQIKEPHMWHACGQEKYGEQSKVSSVKPLSLHSAGAPVYPKANQYSLTVNAEFRWHLVKEFKEQYNRIMNHFSLLNFRLQSAVGCEPFDTNLQKTVTKHKHLVFKKNKML